ncbi:MAG: hypothetical protein OK454_09095 [Thaumarchaeota archaeon]|nr:hypothetical protein [Nitrososphaerota archaeon]
MSQVDQKAEAPLTRQIVIERLEAARRDLVRQLAPQQNAVPSRKTRRRELRRRLKTTEFQAGMRSLG